MSCFNFAPRQDWTRLLFGFLLGAALAGAALPAQAQRVELLAGKRGSIDVKSVDSPKGSDTEFRSAMDVAFVARIPWEDKEELRNGWVVADGPVVRWVSMTGTVRTLAVAEGYRAFTLVAIRPGDGPWACYLWEGNSKSIWKLDAQGNLAWFCGKPREWDGYGDYSQDGPAATASFSTVYGLAPDSKGNLYVADGYSRWALRRIDPEGVVTTLPTSVPLNPVSSLALDEDGKALYTTQGDFPGRILSISLDHGTVTTFLESEEFEAFKGCRSRFSQVCWNRDRLIVLFQRAGVCGLAAIEPKTRRSTSLFLGARQQDLTAGPKGTGSLGHWVSGFAFGPAGQVCLTTGRQLGLLWDWGLASPAASGDGSESKEPPREEKG